MNPGHLHFYNIDPSEQNVLLQCNKLLSTCAYQLDINLDHPRKAEVNEEMQISQRNDCATKDTKNSSINVKTGTTIVTDSEMGKKLLERLRLVTADRREKICKKKKS